MGLSLTSKFQPQLKTDPSNKRDTVKREIATATMGGGMEANKNRFIEEWGAARENLEYNFRWTRRNLAIVGFFGIAIPVFIYKGIVREFVSFFVDPSN